jgi:putative transferase (TIGR04331 family)
MVESNKANFVVSPYSDLWIKGSKEIFILEPFVHFELNKNNELKKYDKVMVAPHYRNTRESLIKDHNFVDEKYNKYIPILAKNLNKIHSVNYDNFFWEKALSLSLLRYITFFYDLFQRCEDHFDLNKHNCTILSEDSYYTPINFQDHRDFFQTTAFGQEQIFSIYIHLFYPNMFASVNKKFAWPIVPNTQKSFFTKVKDKLSSVTLAKIITKILNQIYKVRQPNTIVMGSYFSTPNLNRILLKGFGKIQKDSVSVSTNSGSVKDKGKRNELSKIEDDLDKFDQFFFFSMSSSMPKLFIEDFKGAYQVHDKKIENYKNLKYIVNESWTGSDATSLFISIAQKKGIKHIYNEHNFLQYQFLGNNLKYLFPLVDQFITLGWGGASLPDNVIPGGSLYDWGLNKTYKKKYDILYVEGPPSVKTAEMSASYGEFGSSNAKNSLNFKKSFLSYLGDNILNMIAYRPYPLNKYATTFIRPYMDSYDQMEVLKDHLCNVDFIDDFRYSSKKMIGMSRIVVVDYLSTAYVEALRGFTPTIFFLIEENYFLNDLDSNFYQDLIDVGICHTNPEEAANFLATIYKNPDEWWNDKKVEKARLKFILDNFGNEEEMINHVASFQ